MATRPYFKDRGGPPPLVGRLVRRVRLEEVDALGIVWHGRYASFLEDGREELGRAHGFGYRDFERAGVFVPLRTLHFDYLAPMRYAEDITVETRLHWHDGARLDMDYALVNAAGVVACRAYSVQMMIGRDGGVLLESPPFFRAMQARWRAEGCPGA